MSDANMVLRGFVLVNLENEALTYDMIRGANLPFLVATYEGEFLSGKHGVDGLLKFEGSHVTSEALEDVEFSVADMYVPYFEDGRLVSEPVASTYSTVYDDKYSGEILELESIRGWTALDWSAPGPGVLCVEVKAKLSATRQSTPVMHPAESPSAEKMLGYEAYAPQPLVFPEPPKPFTSEPPKPTPYPVVNEVEKQKALYKSMFPLF